MFPCHCLHVQPQRGSRLRNSAVAHAPRVSPRARRSAQSEGPTRQCRLRGQSHLLGSSVLPLIGFAVWAGDVPSRRLVSSAVKSVLVFSPWEVRCLLCDTQVKGCVRGPHTAPAWGVWSAGGCPSWSPALPGARTSQLVQLSLFVLPGGRSAGRARACSPSGAPRTGSPPPAPCA